MPKLNILIIPSGDWVNSPAPLRMTYVAEFLVSKGHKVYVWQFDFLGKHTNQVDNNVTIVHARTISVPDKGIFFLINGLLQIVSICRFVRKLKLDVILNEQLLHGLLAFFFARHTTLRIFDLIDYLPESASISYYGSLSIVKRLIEFIVFSIMHRISSFSDLGVAVCASLTKVLRATGCQNAFLLTEGVNTRRFTPQSPDAKLRSRLGLFDNVIIFVGVIEPWLDFHTVLEAIAILRKKIPNAQLLLVGPARASFKAEIHRLAHKKGVHDCIIWTGHVPQSEVPLYINLAKCCLMPFRTDLFLSRIVLPVKFFEYSSCGKAIVSTPLPEIIRLETEHVMFYNSPLELVKCIETLLNTNIASTLTDKARAFALKYDYRNIAEQFEQIMLSGVIKKRTSIDKNTFQR